MCERGENEGRDTIVKMANFCRTIFVYCKNQRFKFQTCCFCMLIFEQKKRKCNTVLKYGIILIFFNSKDKKSLGITNPTGLQSSTRVKMNYLAKNSFVRELSGFLLGCVQNPKIMTYETVSHYLNRLKMDKNDCVQDFYNLFSNLISIVLCKD